MRQGDGVSGSFYVRRACQITRPPLTHPSPISFPYLVYRSNTRSFMPASSSMDMASSSGYGFW